MSTTTDSPMGSMILTIAEAAEYLAIPKSTLYTWRARRAGFGPPAIKIGGCLRYRRADLDKWVADHVETFDPAGDEAHSDRAEGPNPRKGQSLSRASGPR